MDVAPLSPEDLAIIAEEQALLDRARAAVAAARPAARPDSEVIRALREEAAQARAEDLAPLLHELSVRQRLARRPDAPALPDLHEPYFAHLQLREGGTVRDYLLGSASLIEGPVRIVDWRVAPVAQIFYRYREGDEYEEEFPGRTAEGTVVARRIVTQLDGQLTGVWGDDRALERGPDGQWRRRAGGPLALASGGAGSAFRPGDLGLGVGASGAAGRPAITALLDAEQLAAIHAPADRALLVLGSAGSGKTTVALHRLAVLAARPDTPLARCLVVVPEEGLARLARRLLQPLGVGEAQVLTLDAWALGLGRGVFGEALPRIYMEAPALVISLKRHPALHDALRSRLGELTPEQSTLARLRRRVADALTDRSFLARVVGASQGTLSLGAIDETIRHTMRQLEAPPEEALRHVVVKERKQAIDGRSLGDGTPEEIAGTIDAEDLPLLLSLRASALGLPGVRVAHLVLDEAEDFSLFELGVLGRQLDERRSATLAGDEAQQTLSSFGGWARSLAALGARQPERCRLEVSYRCPRPIAELAARVLGPLAPSTPLRAAREGVPVGVLDFPQEAQAFLFLAGALGDLAQREPRASVGVLCRDDATARRCHEVLVRQTPARLVQAGAFSFLPGIDVTDLDSAKGLEFDYVVVPDASSDVYPLDDVSRRALHVAITRASHQLLLLAGGPLSPLLRAAAG